MGSERSAELSKCKLLTDEDNLSRVRDVLKNVGGGGTLNPSMELLQQSSIVMVCKQDDEVVEVYYSRNDGHERKPWLEFGEVSKETCQRWRSLFLFVMGDQEELHADDLMVVDRPARAKTKLLPIIVSGVGFFSDV